MKRILLDTTYILPLFGISVRIPNLKDKLISLAQDSKLFINSLSLLEAKWKVLKLAKRVPELTESYLEGLFFILNRRVIEVVNFYEYEVESIATALNRFHGDYFDCSILASAYVYADIFVTEEKERMHDLISNLPTESSLFRKVDTELSIVRVKEI